MVCYHCLRLIRPGDPFVQCASSRRICVAVYHGAGAACPPGRSGCAACRQTIHSAIAERRARSIEIISTTSSSSTTTTDPMGEQVRKPPPPSGSRDETALWRRIKDDWHPGYWKPSTDETHWIKYEGPAEGQDLSGGWRNWRSEEGHIYYAHTSGRSHWEIQEGMANPPTT